MSVIDVSKLKYRKNVGMVLINTKGHIFAGKRIDNNTDAWQMPQGGIDEGETPENAAFRELSEETGIHHSKCSHCLYPKPKKTQIGRAHV